MWATKYMPPLPKRLWCQVKRWMPKTFSKSGQVIMVRLRIAYTRLNVHMHTRLKMVPWAACPCFKEDLTKEHILQMWKRRDKEDLHLDQLGRHSTRNYMVMTRTLDGQHYLSLQLAWPCKSEQEVEDGELVYLVHLKVVSVKVHSYQAPSSLPATAVFTAIIKTPHLISELYIVQCLKRSMRCNGF